MIYDILITILLMIFSLIFRKSKHLAALNFLFMWSLWGWNSWNGDYDNYKYRFDNLTSIWELGDYEFGYELVNLLFNSTGSDFQAFMICFSFVTLFFIAFFCIKYAKFPALFSAMYFIIFIMEFVFIRNYLVHSLLFLAFMLVFEEVKHYKIWYLVLVFIAGSFHSTAYILFIFYFAITRNELLNLKKIILSVFLSLIASILAFQIMLPFLGHLYQSKIDFYATDGGLTTSFYAHFLIVLLTYYSTQIVVKYGEGISDKEKRIFTLFVNINLLSLFFLCLYYHIPYFSRILRFLFAFNLLFLLNGFAYVKIKKYRLIMLSILSMVFFAVIVMFLKSTLSLTLYPLYLNNVIWGDEIYIPDFDFD